MDSPTFLYTYALYSDICMYTYSLMKLIMLVTCKLIIHVDVNIYVTSSIKRMSCYE